MLRKENDMSEKVTRRQWREVAFLLIFEKQFIDSTLDEIIEDAKSVYTDDGDELYRLIASPDEFAVTLAKGACGKQEEADEIIKRNLKGWTIDRISKVSLAILRMAVYEMMYMDDIPVNVSINEAVELAKKYAADDDFAFINGTLGSVSRDIKEQ